MYSLLSVLFISSLIQISTSLWTSASRFTFFFQHLFPSVNMFQIQSTGPSEGRHESQLFKRARLILISLSSRSFSFSFSFSLSLSLKSQIKLKQDRKKKRFNPTSLSFLSTHLLPYLTFRLLSLLPYRFFRFILSRS